MKILIKNTSLQLELLHYLYTYIHIYIHIHTVLCKSLQSTFKKSSRQLLVSKFTIKKKRYPDEEDPMFIAKAGKFITQTAVGTTA